MTCAAHLFVATALLLSQPVPQKNAELIEHHRLSAGNATQGLALSKNAYYTSNANNICRFDTDWQFRQKQTIRIDKVNHVGAIDYHGGYLWAGLLHGPEKGKYDKSLDCAIVAKIKADDLTVVKTWDITDKLTWIDPVCFDGKYLWVGDLSDLGIHRFQPMGDQLVHTGTLRYPKAMHFSQGVRVVGDKLYTIHTFGKMDGLFEFDLPETLTIDEVIPVRSWPIQETVSHLEGFDFLPGKPFEIWHAQGAFVDHYRLEHD